MKAVQKLLQRKLVRDELLAGTAMTVGASPIIKQKMMVCCWWG